VPKTILSRSQRDFVRADTMISPVVIERCVDAFDHLLRDDREGYIRHMATAVALVGDAPKPTAVDVMKTILTRACADRWNTTFRQAHARLTKMLEEK